MGNRKIIQFGTIYLAKDTDQIQVRLDAKSIESNVYKSLEDAGVEFLIHSTSSSDCEFSVVYPEGIYVRLLPQDDRAIVNTSSTDYTSLVLSRRAGTRICVRLEETATKEDFARFIDNPILLERTVEGKFRISGERIWQFNRGEEYRQTLMTEPNTVPDSLNALMGVVDCDDPLSSHDIKRLKGQANYAKFRIEEYMKVPMSSQLRDTLHSYLHTLGHFIGNLQQAHLRTRRQPVLDDLRKDYLITHLSQLISKSEMSALNQKATASAIEQLKKLYPDNTTTSNVITADAILKRLSEWPFHSAISAIFESKTSNNLPINPCSKCNGHSQVKAIKNTNSAATRWMVECNDCGSTLDRNYWQGRGHGAVAMWNKTNPCNSSTLDDVPFLQLKGLTRKEAKEKLNEVNKYTDVKNEHIKALENESTPSQRVWLNKQKSQLAFLMNLLIHARAVLAHQNFLTNGND